MVWRSILIAILMLLLSGCFADLKHKPPEQNPVATVIQDRIQNPADTGTTSEVMREVGENWLYGQGLGDTALAAGAVAAFPPYAAVLLGNAVLSLSGYEPIWFSDALPEDEKGQWQSFYDSVGQSPGRFSAAIAGEEFRSKELIRQRYQNLLEGGSQAQTR